MTPEQSVPKIVVVDDDREILKLVSMLLRRIGAECKSFSEGQAALEYLNTELPDLVILDLMLPGVNGMDILRKLRARDNYQNVPILILSAKADSGTIKDGLDLGADGYITKPYIANALIDRVRLLLANKRQVNPQSLD